MTDQEINEAVARKLGLNPQLAWECWCKRGYCEHQEGYKDFCNSIEAAWEIVEKCEYFCLVKPLHNEQWKCDIGQGNEIIVQWADTAPMAICKAFLKLDV